MRLVYRKSLLLILLSTLFLASSIVSCSWRVVNNPFEESSGGGKTPAKIEADKTISLPEEANTAGEAILPATIEKRPIALAIAGDVMFDSYIYNWIASEGVDYPWTDVAHLFKEADIAAVNFESSSSLRGSSTKPEGYGFRSPPHTLMGMVNSGINYVSIGNNHVLDYGSEAFEDTLEILNDLGIAFSGAGMNYSQAQEMASIDVEGTTIGFLSYTAIIPAITWLPGDASPGVAPLYSESDIHLALENITRSKNYCDVLIVIPHWGIEYASTPTWTQQLLAHAMIDAGADMIIGGHPHVLQGVEFYQNKPIFYSLGNFIFLKMNDEAGKSAVFQILLDKDGFISCFVHPVFIDSCKANLLQEDDLYYTDILQQFAKLCGDLGTSVTNNKIVRPE